MTEHVALASMMLDLFTGNPAYVAVMNGTGFKPEQLSKPLSADRFARHIDQAAPLGIYVLRPDGTLRCAALDFDNHPNDPDPEWKNKTEVFAYELEGLGITPLAEVSQSGTGSHLWVFFTEPIEAAPVRKFFSAVADKLDIKLKEIYPKQDQLEAPTPEEIAKGTKKLGNLIRVPLWHKSHFADYANGWEPIDPAAALASVQRIDPDEFRALCGDLGIDPTITRPTARVKVDDVQRTPGAQPPAEKLAALLANDDKFLASWERNRPDLKDTTGSGYLMSLTNLLVRAKWTDQQITDSLAFWCETHKVEFRMARLKNDLAKVRAAVTVPPAIPSNLPEVLLPGGSVSITTAATKFGELMGATGRFYVRGGAPVRLIAGDNENYLDPIKSPSLCTDLEAVARVVKVKRTKDEESIEPTTCSNSTAQLLLWSEAFHNALPSINIISRCPVLIERDGELIQVSGFDRESGILASGDRAHDMPLSEGVSLLVDLLAEFKFATPGDRARGLAALITPSLVFGGLLGGRAPIDAGEANESQSGKGYRNKLTTGVYNSVARTITQRETGGVGSIQEAFDAAVVAGANFIPLDNIRGKLNQPWLESFLTEDRYTTRIPYVPPMVIDPKRTIVMFTSNAAEMTKDLANRCSCVRILKQPADYVFKTYAEGDLHDHVLANQPKYLGAVFSVVREWHRQGKPMLPVVDHDFRRWGRTLGWIVENILDAGRLLAGHRAAQERIASPVLNWLRDVAMGVDKAGEMGVWLLSNDLLNVISSMDSPGIELGDLDDNAQWMKAVQAIGRKMSKLFRNTTEITIDAYLIKRQEVLDDKYRPRPEYAFFAEPQNTPEVTPE